jgi:tetratricopeptide (TPR) repeat protein
MAYSAVLSAGAGEKGPEQFLACGDVFNVAFGPFDYTSPSDRANLPIVEDHHFDATVESLERGLTSSRAMDDIAYTLRAFPNHHRALNAVARIDLEKGGIPLDLLPAQCWFDRAIRFRPDDGTVWLVYANYQVRKGWEEEALQSYAEAKALLPDSPEVDYNLGLLYFKLGQYDKALAHARSAYAADYPLQGLRRKLLAKGYDVGSVAAPAR